MSDEQILFMDETGLKIPALIFVYVYNQPPRRQVKGILGHIAQFDVCYGRKVDTKSLSS